jgi:hypothetical protein
MNAALEVRENKGEQEHLLPVDAGRPDSGTKMNVFHKKVPVSQM